MYARQILKQGLHLEKNQGKFHMMTIQIQDGIQMMMYGARKQIAPVMVY